MRQGQLDSATHTAIYTGHNQLQTKMERKIRVAITHGDINGVSYEVILKALEDNRILELCTPVVYGSGKVASYYRKALELPQTAFTQITKGEDIRDGNLNLVNVIGEELKPEPGQSSGTAGKAAFTALERAVADLRAGIVDVLVTAPINKHNIQSDMFTFPGHTEYLQASLGDENSPALMILCSENLRVALVTTHLPMSQIAGSLTRELVGDKIKLFSQSLHRDFGIHHPRVAVLALNPHAGDSGLLGSEEEEIIIPAIKDAMEKGVMAFGPYAADGFFGSGAYRHFDGVLAMYHDQGLAPFKTIAMGKGVNFTAGLPYVRTSPDHGTGYDIAGKGLADESSLREAIYMALDVYRNRRHDDEAHSNPLRRQYHDKGSDNVVLDLKSDD